MIRTLMFSWNAVEQFFYIFIKFIFIGLCVMISLQGASGKTLHFVSYGLQPWLTFTQVLLPSQGIEGGIGLLRPAEGLERGRQILRPEAGRRVRAGFCFIGNRQHGFCGAGG